MRSFFLPSLVLITAALFAGIVALSSFNRVTAAKSDLDDAESNLQTNNLQKTAAQVRLMNLRRDTKPAEGFLDVWKDAFLTDADIEKILPTMDSLAVKNVVTSSGKEAQPLIGYPFQNNIVQVQTVRITVSGEYFRIINWLGDVESEYPLARTEAVTIKNDNGLKMSISFSLPRSLDLVAAQK